MAQLSTVMNIKYKYTLLVVISMLISVSSKGHTQSRQGQVFEQTYFDQYAPQTALEMVQRVPGFTLEGGNDARGLGQGGANVLVNGQQITGKGDDVRDQVDRIPASNVTQINLVDGTSLDIPGLSGLVVDIITSSEQSISGSWEWEPEWRPRLEADLFDFEFKISGQEGNLSWAAELQNGSRRLGQFGPETRRNTDGTAFEVRDHFRRFNIDAPGAAVNLNWKPENNHIANLNLEYNKVNIVRRTRDIIDPITDRSGGGVERLNNGEDEWNAQIDGDYLFPLGPGKLKFIGYYRGEHSPTTSRFFDFENDILVEQSEFNQVADEGEAITKAEYSWSPKKGRDWQVSLEGAYNFLDIENQFFDILDPANDGDLTELKIEENRAEAFITHTRQLSDKFTLQTALGVEYSELIADSNSREFWRPKGRLTGTYQYDNSLKITANLEREVGQLNFFDFTNSIALEDEVDSRETNLNLIPDQNWSASLQLNKAFSGGHTIEAIVTGQLFSDLIDEVLIDTLDGNIDTAIGNIGSGRLGRVELNSLIKGDPFGLRGMELRSNLSFQTSNVTDPITFIDRQFSNSESFEWEVDLRHDIPDRDWAWGFSFDMSDRTDNFNPFLISQFNREPGLNDVFIEHKDILGMRVQVELSAIIPTEDQEDRIVFETPRNDPIIDRIDNRVRSFEGPLLSIKISDTF